MQKLAKKLSVVMAALFTVFTLLSYMPASAAVATPKLQMVSQPAAEYKVGDRITFTVTSPNFGGKVEYRVICYNGTTKTTTNLWNTPATGYYYKGWQPAGSYVFPITWVVTENMKPGAYSLTVLVRRVGAKVAYDSHVDTKGFWVVDNAVESIAPVADVTVEEGAAAVLPTTVTVNMKDKTTKTAKVTWAAVDTAKVGKVAVEGTVEGTTLKATVNVDVKAKVLKVDALTAVGAKKLEVKFNKAVDSTKAVVTAKKGSVVVNVASFAWNDAKTAVTLTLSNKLTAGDYTVNVAGLTDTALTATTTAKNEAVTKIVFPTNVAVLDGADATIVTTAYEVYNQYNEDITSVTTGLVATAGKGSASPATGTITIDATANFTTDEKVALSVIDPATSVFVSTVLTVSPKSQVADVKITSLYNADKETLDVNSTPGNFYLVVEANDQYGNSVVGDAAEGDLIVTVSNTVVADVARATNTPNFGTLDVNADGVAETVLPLAGTLTAGTSKITLVSKTTGKMASFDVAVQAAKVVDTLTLSAPAVAVAGETIEIPFTAVDQFGTAITRATSLNGGVNSLTVTAATGVTFVQDYVKNTGKLVVDATNLTTAQTIVVTAVTGTNKVVQLPISISAQAVPTVIGGTTSTFISDMALTGETTLPLSKIVVRDQYGRAMTSTQLAGFLGTTANKYQIVVSSGTTAKVTAADAEITSTSDDAVTLNSVAKGSSTITVKLQKFNAVPTAVDVAGSAYTFTSKVVDKADIVSYELVDLAKTYEDSDLDTAQGYATAVEVNGVMADGKKVALPLTGYYTVSVTDTNASYNPATGNIETTTGYVWGTKTERQVPVIVTVDAVGAPVIIVKSVTITNVAPEATTLSVVNNGKATLVDTNIISAAKADVDTVAELNAVVADAVKVLDQYGIQIVEVAGDYQAIIPSNMPLKTDGTVKAVTDLVAGDTLNVTAIINGKYITFKVIVNN